jgi:hypothetical protein
MRDGFARRSTADGDAQCEGGGWMRSSGPGLRVGKRMDEHDSMAGSGAAKNAEVRTVGQGRISEVGGW